jgi:hypothetical protein
MIEPKARQFYMKTVLLLADQMLADQMVSYQIGSRTID